MSEIWYITQSHLTPFLVKNLYFRNMKFPHRTFFKLSLYIHTHPITLLLEILGDRPQIWRGPSLLGWRRSRVETFNAIRLRGPGSNPGQGRNLKRDFCFSRAPAVVKACHPCRVRPIKTPL